MVGHASKYFRFEEKRWARPGRAGGGWRGGATRGRDGGCTGLGGSRDGVRVSRVPVPVPVPVSLAGVIEPGGDTAAPSCDAEPRGAAHPREGPR